MSIYKTIKVPIANGLISASVPPVRVSKDLAVDTESVFSKLLLVSLMKAWKKKEIVILP